MVASVFLQFKHISKWNLAKKILPAYAEQYFVSNSVKKRKLID